MNERYEIVVVYKPSLDEAAVEAEVAKIEVVLAAHDGELEDKKLWGLQKLAYPIEDQESGSYILLVVSADSNFVLDLRRQLKLNENVLRELIVKKDKNAPDWKPEVVTEREGRDTSSSFSQKTDSSSADEKRARP